MKLCLLIIASLSVFVTTRADAETSPIERLKSTCSKAPFRDRALLTIGNSITHHKPLPQIDWIGDWGMAASRAEKDYSAQFANLLSASTGCRYTAKRMNFASFERGFWQRTIAAQRSAAILSSQDAEVVVVQLSDNVSESDFSTYDYPLEFKKFIAALRANNASMTLICLGPWWKNESKERAVRDGCEQVHGRFVSISHIREMEGNTAKGIFTNQGVAAHPSDSGMTEIAKAIHEALAR